MVIARDCSTRADLDFQGKHSGENFELQFHQHWVRLVWPVAKLFVWNTIILGTGYCVFVMTNITDDFTRRIALVFLTVFFVLAQFEIITRLYRYLLYLIIITDKKCHRIKKTLLTTDDHISIDLWMVQDIQKCQNGILQNLLGYGTIILEAQETVLRLHFTPNVVKKYE
ncbi:MAG: hypothetical protein QF793_03695, partial [Candidatus Peribacteraceae bacterium]|nr:hypothetical protein [Candidatus Peribacteraceae bacterium]